MSGRAEAARARAASPKRLATSGADETAVPKKMCVEADALADLAGAYADMEVDTPTCAGGDDGTTASTSGSASFCSGASVGSAASSGNLLFFGGSAATQSSLSSSAATATFVACKRKRPSMPCGEGTQGQGQQDTVLLGSGKQRSTGPEGSGKKLYLCEEDGCSAFVASRGRCDGCSWRRETIPRVWL